MKYKCISSFTSERGKKYHITDIIFQAEYDKLKDEEKEKFLTKTEDYSSPKSLKDINF